MNLEFFSAIDTGRARSNNEDSVAVDPAAGLAVLADGMGGYNAGEVASAMATSIVLEQIGAGLAKLAADAGEDALRAVVEHAVDCANSRIHAASVADPHCAGMGTTLVVGVFRGDGLLLGHVGDSRGYRWRSGRLERISHDHSLLQEQLDAGLISPAEASLADHKNLVTRALGIDEEVAVELHRHDLVAGDIVLLCSDGLTDMLDDAALQRLLGAGGPLDRLGRSLVDAANDAGGKDNISVILVRVEGTATARSWWPFTH